MLAWKKFLCLFVILVFLAPEESIGQDASESSSDDSVTKPKKKKKKRRRRRRSQAERVDVDRIKDKYWARGEEAELGVVQNRTYSKAKKIQFGILGGAIISDPFLSINNVGGNIGYHLNESWSFHAVGWKHLVQDSDAHEKLKEERNATTNTNEPNYYLGAETNYSFLYGKLSLAGKKIIYYDMHLGLGAGVTATENGTYFTPSAGLGQRFFLSKTTSLRVDYRGMFYREEIVEKQIVTKIGSSVGHRNNFSHSITFGVDFFFGGK